jgi:hypothetical protein
MKQEDTSFQCAPALKRRPGQTCLPPTAMEKMRRVWNRLHPDMAITTRQTRRKGQNDAGSMFNLWNQLRNAMKLKYKCDTEFCLVEKLPGITRMERSVLRGYFRPAKPDEWDKKPTTWLDSFNIEDVMNQYEEAYPKFEFIGPVPIDFDAPDGAWGKCIVTELCKLDVNEANKKGTDLIGIIFNLDPHDQPGSHWVSAFIDIPKKSAYYFDSYGYEAPDEVKVLFGRLENQGITNLYYNDVRHQRKGSECGMYCLFVIICLLKGRSFFEICTNIIDDDTINSFRDILFSTETPRKEAIEKALPKLCI